MLQPHCVCPGACPVGTGGTPGSRSGCLSLSRDLPVQGPGRDSERRSPHLQNEGQVLPTRLLENLRSWVPAAWRLVGTLFGAQEMLFVDRCHCPRCHPLCAEHRCGSPSISPESWTPPDGPPGPDQGGEGCVHRFSLETCPAAERGGSPLGDLAVGMDRY